MRYMHYLLVQPNYYSRYPPLGLLKISTLMKQRGHSVEFIKGTSKPNQNPDEILITSLFTYAWKVVHKTVKFYKRDFPGIKITLGGIYATLMQDHAKKSGANEIKPGLYEDAENLLPDYSLVPDWDASIVFSSRGCIRKCGFCAVPILEPKFESRDSIKDLIYQGHKRIIFWDNNFLASDHADKIFQELFDLKMQVDFNHGLDARFITHKIALNLKKLHVRYLHMAYDSIQNKEEIEKAVNTLTDAGFRGRDLMFYTLYNYKDTPEDFLERLKDLLKWGVVSYPMRYTPLNALEKNKYISPKWTQGKLELVADARRVIGIRGSFPPYLGLQNKILLATSFEEAFKLRKVNKNREIKTNKPFSRELCDVTNDELELAIDTLIRNIHNRSFIKKSSIIPMLVKTNNFMVHSAESKERVLDYTDKFLRKNDFHSTNKLIYLN